MERFTVEVMKTNLENTKPTKYSIFNFVVSFFFWNLFVNKSSALTVSE